MLGLTNCTDCGLKYANQHRGDDPLCQDCASDRDAARARKPHPPPCPNCRDEQGLQLHWKHTTTLRPLGCEDPNCHSRWLVPKIKAAPGFDPSSFESVKRGLGFLALVTFLSISAPTMIGSSEPPDLRECQWQAHDAIVGWEDDLAWEMAERARLAAESPICGVLCECMHYDVQFPTIFGGQR